MTTSTENPGSLNRFTEQLDSQMSETEIVTLYSDAVNQFRKAVIEESLPGAAERNNIILASVSRGE